MIPSPTPTPFLVEIIGGAPSTPSWLVPVIGVAGVLIGGTIALLSTALSDRRKRKADDLRQWDKEIRDYYLKVSPIVEAMLAEYRSVLSDGEIPESSDMGALLRSLYQELGALDIISSQSITNASNELRGSALRVYATFQSNDRREKAELDLSNAKYELHDSVVNNLRRQRKKRRSKRFESSWS